MLDDRDGPSGELLEERLGVREKVEVGIHVGEEIDPRLFAEDVARQRGGAREVILHERPIPFGAKQRVVPPLEILERDRAYAGKLRARERRVAHRIHA